MEADEQAQVETTTVEETQEQTPVQSTDEVQETGRGDLNVALREEREKRQALEASLADPGFIYERARSLGMTEEEAQAAAESHPAPAQPTSTSYNDYQYWKSMDKAKEKFPTINPESLEWDPDDGLAVTAIMRANNLSPEKAAERYYSKQNKAAEVARTEGAKQKEQTISEKENAQTVSSTISTNSDTALYEELLARSRNQNNPKEANKAHLELLKLRMKS